MALLDRFNSNLDKCADFAKECEELLGTSDRSALDPAICEAAIYLRMMLVALCKWLMSLGQAQGPNRVELASSQGYRVNPGAGCEDLVSFALRFDPVIASPANALQATSAQPIDECAEAEHIARRAKSLKEVDAILEADSALLEGLVLETEDLLRVARYDVPGYRVWLESAITG